MGNPKAFMTIPRKEAGYRLISERIHDHGEVEQILNRRSKTAGFSLYGLWNSFLPLGMSIGK